MLQLYVYALLVGLGTEVMVALVLLQFTELLDVALGLTGALFAVTTKLPLAEQPLLNVILYV